MSKGGKREGAGRKPNGKVMIAHRVTPRAAGLLNQLAEAAGMRVCDALDLAIIEAAEARQLEGRPA